MSMTGLWQRLAPAEVVDIQYTNPTEWEDLTTEKLIDLDVDIGRIRVP